MGERSTAGSICDTKPVEVNRKLHKNRCRRKYQGRIKLANHRITRQLVASPLRIVVFTIYVPRSSETKGVGQIHQAPQFHFAAHPSACT